MFSGGDTSAAVDAHAVAVVPNGTTATSPSATATVSNDTVLVFYLDGGTTGAVPSLPTGLTSALAFTDSNNGDGIRAGYASLSATGACPQYTSTFGETVNPSNAIFGTMFTVLVKGAGGGSNALAGTSQQNDAASASLAVANALAGTSPQASFANGALTNTGAGINLAGKAYQAQVSAGTLSVAVPLVGVSVQRSNALGNVRVAIQASGTATATQNADGSLSISVPLSASSVQQAIATAALSNRGGLSGTSQEATAASGSLSVNVSLAGTQVQQAIAQGTLSNVSASNNTSAQLQNSYGALALQLNLSGASQQQNSAVANLGNTTPNPNYYAQTRAIIAARQLLTFQTALNVIFAAVSLLWDGTQQMVTLDATRLLAVNETILSINAIRTSSNGNYASIVGTCAPTQISHTVQDFSALPFRQINTIAPGCAIQAIIRNGATNNVYDVEFDCVTPFRVLTIALSLMVYK